MEKAWTCKQIQQRFRSLIITKELFKCILDFAVIADDFEGREFSMHFPNLYAL